MMTRRTRNLCLMLVSVRTAWFNWTMTVVDQGLSRRLAGILSSLTWPLIHEAAGKPTSILPIRESTKPTSP